MKAAVGPLAAKHTQHRLCIASLSKKCKKQPRNTPERLRTLSKPIIDLFLLKKKQAKKKKLVKPYNHPRKAAFSMFPREMITLRDNSTSHYIWRL